MSYKITAKNLKLKIYFIRRSNCELDRSATVLPYYQHFSTTERFENYFVQSTISNSLISSDFNNTSLGSTANLC